MMIDDVSWAATQKGGGPRTLGEDPKTSPAPPGQGAGVPWLGGDPRTLGEDPMTPLYPLARGTGVSWLGGGPMTLVVALLCCFAVAASVVAFCCVCCFCCVMVVADW